MEITPLPAIGNSTELISKKHVTGVFPVQFQPVTGGTLTVIKIYFRHGKDSRYFLLDAQKVANQGTWNDGTLGAFNQMISDIRDWLVAESFIEASGGIMYRDGDDVVHAFLGTDNLVVTKLGSDAFNSVEYLLIAGGGGGGSWGGYGGGGGAGGYLTGNFLAAVQSYPAVIGSGAPRDANGSNSTFNGLTTIGGSYGGDTFGSPGSNTGGSGGGGTRSVGSNGVAGQGNKGGDCVTSSAGGGGGGGAGTVGGDAISLPGGVNAGGNGGAGLASSISGTAVLYAGGGGGSGDPPGVGGSGGGGNGGSIGSGSSKPGEINKGGGGGGDNNIASAGGSGVVFTRYTNPSLAADILDQYSGAIMAVSFRTLNTAYSGPCLRIRRSSDDAELDIGFVAHYLDTATLLSFIGAGDGYMVKWCDQSGAGNDWYQNTKANQWKLVSAGVFTYLNGKIILPMVGVGKFFNLTTPILFGDHIDLSIGRRSSNGVLSHCLENSGGACPTLWYSDNQVYSEGSTNYTTWGPVNFPASTQYILIGGANVAGASQQPYVNGVGPTGPTGGSSTTIAPATQTLNSASLDGGLQEHIYFNGYSTLQPQIQAITKLVNLYYNAF